MATIQISGAAKDSLTMNVLPAPYAAPVPTATRSGIDISCCQTALKKDPFLVAAEAVSGRPAKLVGVAQPGACGVKKRQMFGRAKVDLLEARLMGSA